MAEMEVDEPKEEKEEVAKDEAEKESNEVKELETDAPNDARPKVKEGSVALNFQEATLNAMPVNGGRMLMSLTEGGMQHLLAGVRANTGIKSGRYMFEVRILETLNPFEQQGSARVYLPRQFLRVGLSQSSSIFLADGVENCCFDCDGVFVHNKSRNRTHAKFWKDQTVALLVNLDPASPNANTVSLFIDGQRCTEPVAIPEEMKGKTLYPTVNYKNMSLEVNFGPVPRAPLPFACRMLSSAAKEDVEQLESKRKDGKNDFVLPVGLPEMGYFEWVDKFLAENPGYVELSDRMILDWALKSGVWNRKTGGTGSKDKPEANTGVPAIDDWSVSRVMAAVAPTMPRNYVVPELKANLVPSERKDALERFTSEDFQRRAVVLMGEPDGSYREWIQKKMLQEKEVVAEAERKKKVLEAARQKLVEERKRKAAEHQRSLELAKKRKLAEEAGEEPPGEEEPPEEPPAAEEPVEEEKPVELTEEEKALKHLPSSTVDIAERELARSYASFSLPQKSEGFESVEFLWDKEPACNTLLKSWVLEKKQTQRAEDLVPGSDFKQQWNTWQKTVAEWRRCQTDFKDPNKRKAAKEKKLEEAKKQLEEERQTLIDAGDEDGAKALEEKVAQLVEKAAAEPELEIDMENLDVFGVEDIKDVGNGEPLFGNFGYEDWILLSTRYELHLLIHSFKKDLNDPDRPSFPLKHLSYYYQKYFRKAWNFQQFGVPEFEDLLELLKDSVSIQGQGEEGHLKADDPCDAPLERLVRLTEDNRRERQRRIDAGDETARLKFTRAAAAAPSYGKGAPKGGCGYGGKGSVKGSHGQGVGRPYPQMGVAQQASQHAVAYNSGKPRTTYAPQTKGGGAYRQSYGRG